MKLWKHSTPRKRMLPVAGALLTSSTLALLATAGGGAGAATDATAGGPVALLATVGNGPSGKIVVAGAIGDWGTALTIDKNGKPDENGNYVKVTLRKGTFEIDSTALNKKTANPRPQVASDTTCSVSASGSAPVTLFNGTGLYKGIAGTVKITETFAFIVPKFTSGAKKGQCNMSNSAQPIAQYSSIIGSGTVRFS